MRARWSRSALAAAALTLGGCPYPAPYECAAHGDCDAAGEVDAPFAPIDAPDDAPIDVPVPPDDDRDDDGVRDPQDNCATVANSDQHDEDGDLIGDVCDVCPHVADPMQVNGDNDGLGDVCDPHPGNNRNQLVLFEPFTSGAPWTAVDGIWTVTNDAMRVTSSSAVARTSRPITVPAGAGLIVETRVVIDALPLSPGQSYAGLAGPVDFVAGTGKGCAIFDNTANSQDQEAMSFDVSATTATFTRVAIFTSAMSTGTVDLTHTRNGSFRCDVATGMEDRGGSYAGTDATVTRLGLISRNLTARYQYVIAYTD